MDNNLLVLVPIIFLIASIISDIRSFTIPNSYSVAIMIFAILYSVITAPTPLEFYKVLGYKDALLVLAVGFVLFCFRIIGAGDIKLLAATALWLPDKLVSLVFVVAILGGIYSLVLLLYSCLRGNRIKVMPYGVPIGLAGCYFLIEQYNIKLF